ncbi:MAG TPA: hypothetical protein DHW15_00640 [Bacteroidetes bacterium]|nr:MAG: hypothetical protein ABR94_09210 [Sphingobacteriales bacterium BACL12 MAG-120802-bin5]KRP10924.1 MAG: hypothetical protein ABR95_13120 [Sphingobacteriales bacterium BACL12 MAG-120813-bin55]HCK20707.1 hypothetical protein [Bacteroidota bacterium]
MAMVMLLVVLSASMGFNVFSHTCSTSGLSEVSMAAIDACCSTPASADATMTDGCCTTNHVLLKLELPATAAPAQVLVDGPVLIPLPFFSTFFQVPAPSVAVATYPKKEAPPLCPPDAQVLYSVFLI